MSRLIIGNYLSFIGSMLFVYTGTLNNKNKILITDSTAEIFQLIGRIVLGGYTGAISKFFSLIRNYLCYKDKLKTKKKFFMSVLFIILFFCFFKFNNFGFFDFLPLFNSLFYMWYVTVKSIKTYKKLQLISISTYLVYNVYIFAYLSAVFDLVSLLTNLTSLIKIIKSEKKNQ